MLRSWEKIVLAAWVIGCSYSALPYALGRMGEAFFVGFSFAIGSLLLFFSGYLLEGHQPIQRIRRSTDRLRKELSRSRVGRLGIALFLGGVRFEHGYQVVDRKGREQVRGVLPPPRELLHLEIWGF